MIKKNMLIILISIIIVNIILSIILGIRIGEYKILSEDDKQYINTIKELKNSISNIDKQLLSKKQELENINKNILDQNKILDGTAKYIMKINISQTHFTLDIEQHLKDSMNDIDIYIEVSKEFYDKYNVGDTIADDFRVGSLIFKGSFGSWDIRVSEKQIV